jgi:hypothetical protein
LPAFFLTFSHFQDFSKHPARMKRRRRLQKKLDKALERTPRSRKDTAFLTEWLRPRGLLRAHRSIDLHGKYELRGGSKEDRLAAKEWISMFCHDVVVPEP